MPRVSVAVALERLKITGRKNSSRAVIRLI